jgi:hypothetical protein
MGGITGPMSGRMMIATRSPACMGMSNLSLTLDRMALTGTKRKCDDGKRKSDKTDHRAAEASEGRHSAN